MHARIDSEMVKKPPIQADDATLVAGAQIYHEQCAACHGLKGKPVSFASHMFPRAPGLLEKHRNGNAVVSLLLANADKPMSPAALAFLSPEPAASPVPTATEKKK